MTDGDVMDYYFERGDWIYEPIEVGMILLPPFWMPERKKSIEEIYTESLYQTTIRFLETRSCLSGADYPTP